MRPGLVDPPPVPPLDVDIPGYAASWRAAASAADRRPAGLTRREGSLRRVWLFVAAITLHNFPEGVAVGVGYAGGDYANATALAIGIGLQNAPEGLTVAVALRREGYSRGHAFMVAALTAAVEPVGGFLGAAVVTLWQQLLPFALTFAAGAMLYVISHEIIPETHTRGHQKEASAGLMIGLVLMMFLDVALG